MDRSVLAFLRKVDYEAEISFRDNMVMYYAEIDHDGLASLIESAISDGLIETWEVPSFDEAIAIRVTSKGREMAHIGERLTLLGRLIRLIRASTFQRGSQLELPSK